MEKTMITKDMERAGQYSSRKNAYTHASTVIGRKHVVKKSICYRMNEDNSTDEYLCFVPVLQ